jgi:hypothetical protein
MYIVAAAAILPPRDGARRRDAGQCRLRRSSTFCTVSDEERPFALPVLEAVAPTA